MNQQIKFKIWHHQLEQMFPVFGIRFSAEGLPVTVDFTGREPDMNKWANIENVALRQFTNYLDRSGMEVYDGDICSIDNKADFVEVYRAGFAWRLRWAGVDRGALTEFTSGELQLIGNIYQPLGI